MVTLYIKEYIRDFFSGAFVKHKLWQVLKAIES